MIRFPAIAIAFAFSAFAGETPSRPNVLFLFTDDQQHDTIAALGNTHIRTPNIDRIVRQGTAFTHACIMGGSSPGVCMPSRASLLTGRTLWNIENQAEYAFEISGKCKTLPEVFRENGYLTFATGKNDPGRSGQFGRAYSHGGHMLFQGMSNHYNSPLHAFREDGDYSQSKPLRNPDVHSAEIFADDAIRFIKEHASGEKPFYAYVAFQTPHDPWQAPQEFLEMYDPAELPLPASFLPEHPFDNGMLRIRDESLLPHPRTPDAVRKAIAKYYATLTHTDAQIGRILAALEAAGQYDDTLIVLASDNGCALGSHGLIGKQNLYEPAIRVPLIIAGPGIPKGQTRKQLAYLFDINPTLCELAGLPVPDSVEFKSLKPAIHDPAASHRDHLYLAFMSWQRAIRDSRHKLIEYCVDGTRHTQLFDLKNDPDELQNLVNSPEKQLVLTKLRTLLETERARLNDGNSTSDFTTRQGIGFWTTYHNTSQ